MELFANAVVAELNRAFSCTATHQQRKREKMWGLYHSIRTSSSFVGLWVELLKQSAGIDPLQTFYQHVTDQIFQYLIQHHFPVVSTQLPESTNEIGVLGYEEANAVRYVAGFVCRAVKKKISSSSSPLKQDVLLALWELLEDEIVQYSDDEDEPSQDSMPSSSDWIKSVDRGGLIHVTEQAYIVFSAIEEVVRTHLRIQNIRKIADGEKHELTQEVQASEDVQFHWCILAVDMSVEVSELLLKMIIEMWITIRGFSFAKCYMELYKQREKKITQRSKGLRKELFTSKVGF